MEKLIHLIYVSSATQNMDQEELFELFTKSSLNNQEKNITGLLLYIEGSFLQVLEGHKDAVFSLYHKILKDPRHSNSKKVLVEPIEERGFENWGMGFAGVTKEELRQVEGLQDFFTNESIIQSIDDEKVQKVLSAFKEGRWREKIN